MGIVKRNQVNLAEPRRASSRGGGTACATAEPQARIVEQNGTQAIVEVTCGCGSTFFLDCLCPAPRRTGSDFGFPALSPVEGRNADLPSEALAEEGCGFGADGPDSPDMQPAIRNPQSEIESKETLL